MSVVTVVTCRDQFPSRSRFNFLRRVIGKRSLHVTTALQGHYADDPSRAPLRRSRNLSGPKARTAWQCFGPVEGLRTTPKPGASELCSGIEIRRVAAKTPAVPACARDEFPKGCPKASARRKAPDFAITVDTREPEHTAWQFSDAVQVTRACLPSGDYAPAGHELQAAVERKTAGDFIACVTYERERFWRELERLQGYSFAVVIVETSVEAIMAGAYRSQTNPWAVLTSALAIMCDFRIPVLFADDRQTGARCCEWLLRRWVTKHAAAAAQGAA